jgi:hypothetical protein
MAGLEGIQIARFRTGVWIVCLDSSVYPLPGGVIIASSWGKGATLINALKYAKNLEEAGIPRGQAEA